jgi:hypothetical protein
MNGGVIVFRFCSVFGFSFNLFSFMSHIPKFLRFINYNTHIQSIQVYVSLCAHVFVRGVSYSVNLSEMLT